MPKFGKFNYADDASIADVLEQYKDFVTKNTDGTVPKAEFDQLKKSLEEKETKLNEYTQKERSVIISNLAKEINPNKADQLSKYTQFDKDFDFTDTKALKAKLAETNKDMYGEVSDPASKHKAVETAGQPKTKTEPKKQYRFVK